MTEPASFTRQDVARIAGVSDDVLSFWLKRGLLVPASGGGGRGHHRRFDAAELRVAGFLREARSAGLNIGVLDPLIAQIREGLALVRSASVPRRLRLESISGVSKPSANLEYKTLLEGGHLSEEEAENLYRSASTFDVNNSGKFVVGMIFDEGDKNKPGYIFVWNDALRGWSIAYGEEPPYLEPRPRFLLAFDSGAAFANHGRVGE